MDASTDPFGIQTLSIHAGETSNFQNGATIAPITMATSFKVDPAVSFSAEELDEHSPHVYTRWGNPTIDILEKKIAALEDGEAALAFGSGIAAVSGLILHLLKSGDRILMSDISYAGVREFGNDLLAGYGIEVISVNMADMQAVEAALSKPVQLAFLETPCNPICRLTDIRAVAERVHAQGGMVAVDSTFATPLATRPLGLGADFVIHSLTKYLGGHGDAIGGIVVGKKAAIQALKARISIHLGGIISPFNAWLINRGLATFPLRMQAHARNARQLSEFLEAHPRVKKVIYPGLPSHPQAELAQQQMQNFSGMLAFQTEQPQIIIQRMVERLKIFHYAVSLGHHKSLIFYIPTDAIQASSFQLDEVNLAAYREYAGDGVFRVSVGLEDANDLCRDLEQCL
ncbi:MAG: PLP-dependent aspartate aminotransferase family protein [Bacteroidota bacterium]